MPGLEGEPSEVPLGGTVAVVVLDRSKEEEEEESDNSDTS